MILTAVGDFAYTRPEDGIVVHIGTEAMEAVRRPLHHAKVDCESYGF